MFISRQQTQDKKPSVWITLKQILCSLILFVMLGNSWADDRVEMLKWRHTTINLMQRLVDEGVISPQAAKELLERAERATAQQLQREQQELDKQPASNVSDIGAVEAQEGVSEDAGTDSAESSEEITEVADQTEVIEEPAPKDKTVVRVPYVPEFVLEQIRTELRGELRSDVVQDVMAQAKSERWGVPEALPSWISNIKLKGDLRLRAENITYSDRNILNSYLDVSEINDAGGFGKADRPFLNITEDRERLRARARLGLDAKVSTNTKAVFRLSTGNTQNPISTNQTLGNSGNRYEIVMDQAYLRYQAYTFEGFQWGSFWGGRMPNPWVHTDLVWDSDLGFEGLAATFYLNLIRADGLEDVSEFGPKMFLTLGAFPLQERELSAQDKWLFGSQIGLDWVFSNQSKVIFAVAYYNFDNLVGQRNDPLNDPEGLLTQETAPEFMQKGNTLFDILDNPNDLDADLLALAADYNLLNPTLVIDLAHFAPYHLVLYLDYVKNIGYEEDEVSSRAIQVTGSEVEGYQVKLVAGWPTVTKYRDWQFYLAFKHLEADAVLDAFTDSDFHLGGTDTEGWLAGFQYGLDDNTWVTIRWLSADEINGPPFGVDVAQIDLNVRF